MLGLPRVGITDNFFDLGGHSLLAIQICARLSAALGKKLELVALFRFPTIGELAEYIDLDDKLQEPKVVDLMNEWLEELA